MLVVRSGSPLSPIIFCFRKLRCLLICRKSFTFFAHLVHRLLVKIVFLKSLCTAQCEWRGLNFDVAKANYDCFQGTGPTFEMKVRHVVLLCCSTLRLDKLLAFVHVWNAEITNDQRLWGNLKSFRTCMTIFHFISIFPVHTSSMYNNLFILQ